MTRILKQSHRFGGGFLLWAGIFTAAWMGLPAPGYAEASPDVATPDRKPKPTEKVERSEEAETKVSEPDPASGEGADRPWRVALSRALNGHVSPGPERDGLSDMLVSRSDSIVGRVDRFRERRALNRAELLGVAPSTSVRDPIGYLVEIRVATEPDGRMLPSMNPIREFTAGRTVADAIASSGLSPELALGKEARGLPGAAIEPFFLWIVPGEDTIAISTLAGSEYAEAWEEGQRAYVRRTEPPAPLARDGKPSRVIAKIEPTEEATTPAAPVVAPAVLPRATTSPPAPTATPTATPTAAPALPATNGDSETTVGAASAPERAEPGPQAESSDDGGVDWRAYLPEPRSDTTSAVASAVVRDTAMQTNGEPEVASAPLAAPMPAPVSAPLTAPMPTSATVARPRRSETRADRLLRRLEARFGSRESGSGPTSARSEGLREGASNIGAANTAEAPSLDDVADARRRAREARQQAEAAQAQAEAAAEAYRAAREAAERARSAAETLRGSRATTSPPPSR